MKHYRGKFNQGDPEVWVIESGDVQAGWLLPSSSIPNARVFNAGRFGWGSDGPDAARLAFCLALDVLGSPRLAMEAYRDLLWDLVVGLRSDAEWEVSEEQVREVIQQAEAEWRRK
jgi:hypothetical protein